MHESGPPPSPETPGRPWRPAGPKCKPTQPDIHQQTGIYTGVVTTGGLQVLRAPSKPSKPVVHTVRQGSSPSLPDITKTRLCSRGLSTFIFKFNTESPDYHQSQSSVEPGNSNSPKAGAISSSSDEPYFAMDGNKPKVQISFQRRPGDVSRELALIRLQREYSRLNIEDLLTEKGIDWKVFIPRHPRNREERRSETGNLTRPFLLLEFFDNEDYECRTPEEWLALGDVEGSPDQRPVPATALLPKHHQTPDENDPFVEYGWHLVGVLDYNKKKHQYLVQEVQDQDGNPILNPNQWKKVNASQGGPKRWIPRIRLCFHGEDPRVFAQRVSFAQRFREVVENRILCDLSVDHMPPWGGNPRLSPETMEKIKRCANSAPGLRLDITKKHEQDLEKEAAPEQGFALVPDELQLLQTQSSTQALLHASGITAGDSSTV
ncbi:hypothetical protein OJAV_G00039100 [Oryzias javanicus]|uniref:Uncharacterized protein n=1 Tax=Oryzias javanicus TaxID=123683 RepID=A0A3S2Q7I3_ORYJA|nr:hypothetical protein OJAV_G00039100 [Oryzias javanicus]